MSEQIPQEKRLYPTVEELDDLKKFEQRESEHKHRKSTKDKGGDHPLIPQEWELTPEEIKIEKQERERVIKLAIRLDILCPKDVAKSQGCTICNKFWASVEGR